MKGLAKMPKQLCATEVRIQQLSSRYANGEELFPEGEPNWRPVGDARPDEDDEDDE